MQIEYIVFSRKEKNMYNFILLLKNFVYEEWDFLTEQYTEENFLTNLNDSLVAAVFNVKTIFIVILIVAVVGIISYIRENKLK